MRVSACSTSPPGERIETEPSRDVDHRVPGEHGDAELLERPPAFVESDAGKLVSTRSAASTRSTVALLVSTARKSRPERLARELGDLPGHLDAGRAGADDDEGEPASPPLGIGLGLGRLEGDQDPVADLERAVERLQLRRVRAATRRGRSRSSASRRRRRACRNRAACRASPFGRSPSTTSRRVEVEADDLGEQNVRVPWRLSTARSGAEISAGESAPVATW